LKLNNRNQAGDVQQLAHRLFLYISVTLMIISIKEQKEEAIKIYI